MPSIDPARMSLCAYMHRIACRECCLALAMYFSTRYYYLVILQIVLIELLLCVYWIVCSIMLRVLRSDCLEGLVAAGGYGWNNRGIVGIVAGLIGLRERGGINTGIQRCRDYNPLNPLIARGQRGPLTGRVCWLNETFRHLNVHTCINNTLFYLTCQHIFELSTSDHKLSTFFV